MTVLSLCFLFVFLSIAVALTGSGVYQNTITNSNENYDQRIALSYITNQLRRSDIDDSILLGTFDGTDAMILQELGDHATYLTILYHSNGALCELYIDASQMDEFDVSDGIAIVEISDLNFQLVDDMLEISVVSNGGEAFETRIYPRCGVEEVLELESQTES